MRLPIKGGRVYVMTDAVTRAAGYGKKVRRGQIRIDMKSNLATVNSKHWEHELASKWGGADMDDALWCLCFRDYNGKVKILCWRSPNQQGEFVILRPADRASYEWQGEIPRLDSRQLKDGGSPKYLNLIDEGAPLGQGLPYEPHELGFAMKRIQENAGTLGWYCNFLMIVTALDMIPNELPAPLEDVVDNTVKKGGRLAEVKEWVAINMQRMIDAGQPVPRILAHRLSRKHPVVTTTDHWLDKLERMALNSIARFIEEAEALPLCPPDAVVQYGLTAYEEDAESMRRIYGQIIGGAIRTKGKPETSDFEQASRELKAFLDSIQEEDALPALADLLTRAVVGNHSDGAAWQRDSTGAYTLEMLRRLGVINRLILKDDELEQYIDARPEPVFDTVPAKINGVWFNWVKSTGFNGAMSDLPKEDRDHWKTMVAETAWEGKKLEIRHFNDRLVAYTEQGNLMGFIDKTSPVKAGGYQILAAHAHDGNLAAYLQSA